LKFSITLKIRGVDDELCQYALRKLSTNEWLLWGRDETCSVCLMVYNSYSRLQKVLQQKSELHKTKM